MLSTITTQNRAPLLPWLMLILMLHQASSFTLSLTFRGPIASDTLAALVTKVWLAMYAWSALGLFVTSGINWITWLVRYRLLLICVLTGTAFSVAWSIDSSLTIERSVHLVGTTLVALYIGFSLPLNQILKTSAVVLSLIMITSIVAALLVPELGLEEYQGRLVWAGTLASKNTLGFWAAINFLLCASLCFWTIPTAHRLLYVAGALLSLLCLYNSVSATSLLALLTGGAVMLYLHAAFSLRLSMLAMTFLAALVLCMLGMAFFFIDTAELIGRSGDMTGRGEVWAQTWKLILERPLTGYGYGTIWYPTDDTLWIQKTLTDFSWTVFHAHNGLLQLASEIGLPLTALALIMIAQQLVEIVYCQYKRQQPGVLFVLAFTVALLVSNYSEARLLVNRELYWIFFIALPVSMLRQVSVSGLHAEHSAGASQATFGNAIKSRKARDRKAYHTTLKERMKQHSGLKVINPVTQDPARRDAVNHTSPSPDKHSASKQQHDPRKELTVSQTKLIRLKNNRRHKKTG